MNVAFIPVRGGSKSIPLKNIKLLAGKPLVYWTMKAACECKYIDKVYIATDSSKIADVVNEIKRELEGSLLKKIEVVGRSKESASDTASTEFAMLEFARERNFSAIVLIQATSPLLRAEDLNGGFEIYMREDTDSVLSVVRQKRFCWSENENGYVVPENYDIFNRPRRQDFTGYLVENGAFYITDREYLLNSQNRISGKIRCYEMSEESYYEIDEPDDWVVIENQLKNRVRKKEVKREIPEIKMFLTDCDGCLTDGGMYYTENGDEIKKFNTLDGKGFSLLRECGIITGIITGENCDLVSRRFKKLHLDILKMGVREKASVIRQLCKEYKISLENVAYVGDDMIDLEAICMVGLGCTVANGMNALKENADYVAERQGGNGAVREIIDYILERR